MHATIKCALVFAVGSTVSFLGLVFVVCHTIGCSACRERFSDGSCASDSGPVMANELSGEWCEEPRPNGSELCLRVHEQAGITEPVYEWLGHSCVETGVLTGGLEFSPITHDKLNCIGAEFYSASVDWTRTGLEVFLDNGRVLKLNWTE